MHRTMKALSAVSIAATAALFLGTGSSIAATQAADNHAGSKASNEAATQQRAAQEQGARSSSGNRGCGKFCAGGGGNLTPQDQNLDQKAHTGQDAFSAAIAKQHNLNVNAPVSVEGKSKAKSGHDGSDGWWNPFGGGSANQVAFNGANSRASNSAWTGQGASQSQWADSSSGNSDCWAFCTGGGGNLTPQSQNLGQHASTDQSAASLGAAKQQNLNTNTPASIGGENGLKGHSGSSADQLAANDAASKATNQAATKQGADQSQTASSSSGNDGCSKFCTGGGGNLTPQDQNLNQSANTSQQAASAALANQRLMNVNIPITIVGWGSVGTAGGSANQLAANSASSAASNQATTQQHASQAQQADSSSGNSGCTAFCTGGGGNLTPQSQNLGQHASTTQAALSVGAANQGASNTNSPVAVG